MTNKNIVVVCEVGDGQTETGNSQLIATATQISSQWGARIICLLAGPEAASKAPSFASYVDEIRLVEFSGQIYNSPQHFNALRTLVQEISPQAVLFGHSFIGMDMAPRIASQLGVNSLSNVLEVAVNENGFTVKRPVYRGRLHATMQVDALPIVMTLQGRACNLPEGEKQAEIKPLESAKDDAPRVRSLEIVAPVKTGVNISKEEIIVAGGRGLGEKENLSLIETLAQKLNGIHACSRPLVDMGWLGPEHQVGMSGNMVKPKLYIACGISGAAEHLYGMKEAGTIVAINKDPDASIFGVAHIGIVGDVTEIIPELISQVKS
jgi:electron transfer flavoprotein alpha subunit